MTEARHISDCLPAWLMREIERVRAAAAENSAAGIVGGPKAPGGAAIDPPVALDGEGTGAQHETVDGPCGDKGRPGSEASDYRAHMRPALRIVSSRGEPTRSTARSVFPTRRVGSPLVLIGGIDHAASPSASA